MVKERLERGFFEASTIAVARSLLGAFVSVGGSRGRIVETEAYLGRTDPASHASRGPTPRCAGMFGEVGRLYVYRSYGIHSCLNFVAHPQSEAGAVLIRALEPVAGLESMRERRGRQREAELCSGPGKLCQALGIDGSFDGEDLFGGSRLQLELSAPFPPGEIARGPRVGISKAKEKPYRFWVRGCEHVSRMGSSK